MLVSCIMFSVGGFALTKQPHDIRRALFSDIPKIFAYSLNWSKEVI